ncbi:Thioredoxin-like fold [Phaffia rhodozyma]|uniref:Glutaredoxin-like protein n=1 Tax=Phaffia rhodozyma TaxID=264483 RepID=A0A0F7SQX8_PHARH|nr:Thioredoxin-like fold [Phaffia rhodozyma]
MNKLAGGLKAPNGLPRLILFSGNHCSLCDVAKTELEAIRQKIPFELSTFNIHSDQGDLQQVKRWRRLYKYDIPVLHMEGVGRIMKHRIDRTKLEEILNSWTGPVDQTEQTKRLNPVIPPKNH